MLQQLILTCHTEGVNICGARTTSLLVILGLFLMCKRMGLLLQHHVWVNLQQHQLLLHLLMLR